MTDGIPTREELEERLLRLEDMLERERRTSEQWRRVAEERRVAMERLRQRRIVRLVLAVAQVVLPPARRLRGRLRLLEDRLRGLVAGVLGARHRLSAGQRERDLRRAVARLPRGGQDHRSVTAIVLTRDGRDNLERLLPALARTAHASLEVVVVDNASAPDTQGWLADREREGSCRVIRLDEHHNFSEANDVAARQATSDLLLFLNDDVEPLDEHWLSRMLALVDDDVVAVGAQLVYPRRSMFDGRQRDVGIQHLGIRLCPDGEAPPQARNVGGGADPRPDGAPFEVAAVTAACLLVHRGAYGEVGGFDPGYQFGAEDVDLCWRLRRRGGRIVVCPGAVLWHREGATRHRRDDATTRKQRQQANWDRLHDRFGPAMWHALVRDRLLGRHVLGDQPIRVAITVTRDLESAGYGDWYTAHELGAAFARLGWTVRYVERYRDAWYDLDDGVDLLIVLHDVFDVRRVARPGLTTVAWVRNWADRWVGHPWFDDLDVVVASSQAIAERLEAASRRRDVPVLALATNPDRFRPDGRDRRAVVLAANHWGEDRGVAELLAAIEGLELYGKGWDEVPAVAARWRGHLAYDDLAGVYAGAVAVVDQTAAPTRPYGALNSRVFDALASGAMVVTDQREGATEWFGDQLPVYEGPDDAARLVAELLADPGGTARRAAALRDVVLAEHTYDRRAEQFRDLVLDHLDRPSFLVRIGAPTSRQARNWGDTYFAEGLVSELRAAGHRAVVQTMDQWADRRGLGYDATLHLKGRSRCPRAAGQVHAIWVISHPDEVDPVELDAADVVFVASPTLAEDLRSRTRTPVHVMLQAVDERRFRPRPHDPARAHQVVFVGNSRFVERPMVRAAVEAELPLVVHGANWERFVPPGVVGDTFVENDEVPVVYSSADVVLNDHWPDMRRAGIISNRVFDALACGACVVSDSVVGMDAVVGDAVAMVDDPGDVGPVVRQLLADPDRRRDMGARGRDLVLAEHTFRHRADDLVRTIGGIASDRVVQERSSLGGTAL